MHFLSQPQIQSNSANLFEENITFCLSRKFFLILQVYLKTISFSVLAALSFEFKKKSESFSFSVLAANSKQFYKFTLRQYYFSVLAANSIHFYTFIQRQYHFLS